MSPVVRLFDQPSRVFGICIFFFIVSTLLQRTPEKLFGLYRERHLLQEEILKHDLLATKLSRQITLAREPEYIEQQAINLYDLALPEDLVFVFSDDNE